MATNLALDDNLIEEARALGGQRTKKEVVTQALLEFVQRRKQLKMLELFQRPHESVGGHLCVVLGAATAQRHQNTNSV